MELQQIVSVLKEAVIVCNFIFLRYSVTRILKFRIIGIDTTTKSESEAHTTYELQNMTFLPDANTDHYIYFTTLYTLPHYIFYHIFLALYIVKITFICAQINFICRNYV